jgi:hypothetical protein
MVQGKPNKVVTVNIKDVCADTDCDGCCSKNTGNGKYKLIDIERWPASDLYGFSSDDYNFESKLPNSLPNLRPGAPQSDVTPICYKVVGPAA